MSVQLQWGLEQTAGSTLEFATGLIRAATTDNVQPLALLACEKFGATLPISQHALRKIEHEVLPTPEPAFLSFLKATVGYSANDCASHLGRSLAGQQFLALAAALITTIECDKSSQVIHMMLCETAKDKTLLPTLRQVRDLLKSIEPRCHRIGLMADIVGCQLMLEPAGSGYFTNTRSFDWLSPGFQGIMHLVDGLRQLQRVGDASTTHVTITTGLCAPWTISFVNWCIGYRPCVLLSDGTSILEQENSKVVVTIDYDEASFRVVTHSSINSPCDLLDASGREYVTGMVTIAEYGEILLQSHGFVAGLSLRAFHEAMPQALRTVAHQFALGNASDQTLRVRHSFLCYPEEWVVGRTYAALFEQEPKWHNLPPAEMAWNDLPLFKRLLASRKEECDCTECSPSCSDDPPDGRRTFIMGCAVRGTLERFMLLVVDILSLSLFQNPDRLMIYVKYFGGYRFQSDGIFQLVKGILNDDLRTPLTFDKLLHSTVAWGLKLLGHDISKLNPADDFVLVSSSRGQVAWLAVCEAFRCDRRGSLSFLWSPGVLRYNGDVYTHASAGKYAVSVVDQPSSIPKLPSPTARLRPCNLFKNLETHWDVAAFSDDLIIGLIVQDRTVTSRETWRSPFLAISNMMKALVMERCAHDPDVPLQVESPDISIKLTSPLNPLAELNKRQEKRETNTKELYVVAVDGDDKLRFAALASIIAVETRCVLRGRACLACCVDFCRNVDAQVLIL